jgi:perosamine synthetase
MKDYIPVNTPDLSGNEKKYLADCIDTGWISGEGRYVQMLEEQLRQRVDRRHAIAVSNGTAALEIAVRALQIEPGSEVILPAFTIISGALAILGAGLRPVLVDSDPSTWNMDPARIEEKITPRTKAILAVHIYGLPTDMQPVLDIAARHGLRVIEDAAEMHGQTYRGKPCGSFGDISTFSFYSNKIVTTGEGGMVLTDDDALAARCRSLRNLCFQPERRFVHEELSGNYRLSNLQAAVGVAQLERWEALIARKRAMGRRYNSAFSSLSAIELPPEKTMYAENIYWVYGMVLADSVAADAAEAMRRLEARGIGARPFFWGMHEQPVLRRLGLFAGDHYPVTERISRRGFYIPSGLGLTEAQQKKVIDVVRQTLSEFPPA